MFDLSLMSLVFLVFLIGCYVGNIKVKGVSLGLSAVLVTAMVVGGMLTSIFPQKAEMLGSDLKILSQLGTALFIPSIGLLAGADISCGVTKKNVTYFFVGFVAVCIALGTMEGIACIDAEMNKSLMRGILCGAMTSTPGLTALCENDNVNSEYAVLGYGCSYLFGVIGTVLAAQWVARKEDASFLKNNGAIDINIAGNMTNCLLWIALSVVLGNIVGNFNVPYLNVSAGGSGGMLCVSILLGAMLRRRSMILKKEEIDCYRELGLILFFVGNGITAGMNLTLTFEFKWFLYGALLTILPICLVYLIGKFLFKLTKTKTASLIAGAMTSSPAIGTLIAHSRDKVDLSIYSFSYLGAMLAMVLFI